MKNKDIDIDMRKLKWKSLFLVWCALFFHATLYVFLTQHWRWGLKDEIRNGDVWGASLTINLLVAVFNVTFANSPDFFSIIIYLVLWLKLRRSITPLPIDNESDHYQNDNVSVGEGQADVFPGDVELGSPPPHAEVLQVQQQQVCSDQG